MQDRQEKSGDSFYRCSGLKEHLGVLLLLCLSKVKRLYRYELSDDMIAFIKFFFHVAFNRPPPRTLFALFSIIFLIGSDRLKTDKEVPKE